MKHVCYLCFVFVMLSGLLIAALWSPAGKGLTSWLLSVMFNCVFVTFSCGVRGLVWYFNVSITDLCRLSYIVIQTSMPKKFSFILSAKKGWKFVKCQMRYIHLVFKILLIVYGSG